jgi:hypothetical protein
LARRYQRINGGSVTPAKPKPPSPTTDAYFGVGAANMFNLGGNPHATRNWSGSK